MLGLNAFVHIRMVNAIGSTSQFVHPTLDIFGSKLKNTVGPEFNLFTLTAYCMQVATPDALNSEVNAVVSE